MAMAFTQLILLSIVYLVSLSFADGRSLSFFKFLFISLLSFVLCFLLCLICFVLLCVVVVCLFASLAQRLTWIGLIRLGSEMKLSAAAAAFSPQFQFLLLLVAYFNSFFLCIFLSGTFLFFIPPLFL